MQHHIAAPAQLLQSSCCRLLAGPGHDKAEMGSCLNPLTPLRAAGAWGYCVSRYRLFSPSRAPSMQSSDHPTHPLLQVLEAVAPAGEDMETEQPQQGSKLDRHQLLYCERFVEWLTDLLSQLPTRRFVHSLLEDKAILVKCKMSALYSHPQGESAASAECSACTISRRGVPRGVVGLPVLAAEPLIGCVSVACTSCSGQ